MPGAVATMSTVPKEAQISAKAEQSDDRDSDRPAGRRGRRLDDLECRRQKSELFVPATDFFFGNGMIFLADVMDSRLQVVQLRVATVAADQFIMVAVFDDATAFDGDDAIGVAHGRQTVGDDKNSPACAICFMFCWMARSLS